MFGNIDSATIQNVMVSNITTQIQDEYEHYVCGIASYARNSTIKNCTFESDLITGRYSAYWGGIVQVDDGTIQAEKGTAHFLIQVSTISAAMILFSASTYLQQIMTLYQ